VVFRVKSAKSNKHVTLLLGEFDSLGEAKAYVYGTTTDKPRAHPFGLAIFAVTSTGTEAPRVEIRRERSATAGRTSITRGDAS
jgi:hypothetical protein